MTPELVTSCQVGGYMGLCLGLSLYGLADLVDLVCLVWRRRRRKFSSRLGSLETKLQRAEKINNVK